MLRDGEEVRLTPKEFELLTYLAQHPGRVLTHRTILKAIWGPNAVDQPEHLRVLIGALRKKIEPTRRPPKYILTEPWVGYRFADECALNLHQQCERHRPLNFAGSGDPAGHERARGAGVAARRRHAARPVKYGTLPSGSCTPPGR